MAGNALRTAFDTRELRGRFRYAQLPERSPHAGTCGSSQKAPDESLLQT